MKKKCSKCKEIKEDVEFYKNRIKCKKCYIKICKDYSKTPKGRIVRINATKKYRKNNPDKVKESTRNGYLKHSDERRKESREYYRKNKEYYIKYAIQSNKKRRRDNPQVRLRDSISSSIRLRLNKRLKNKGGRSTFSFLPYTLEQLTYNLQSKFQLGMSWQNYGKWHIDHVIPDCRFNYKSVDDEEFQKCWSLDNLQPLWAEENWRKNKY